MARYPVFMGIKVSRAMAAEIRLRADREEQTASAVVRRLLAGALVRQDERPQTDREAQ